MTETPERWTVETVREYLLAVINANDRQYGARFDASQAAVNSAFDAQQTAMQTALIAQKLAIDTALAAADRATAKAELASDKRFDAVNEFRATLSDQQQTLMPRIESLNMHAATDAHLTLVQGVLDARINENKMLIERNYDSLLAEISKLRESASSRDGRSAGANTLWGYAVGAVGVVAVIASIIINIVK